jgi:prevent-host-death family protein
MRTIGAAKFKASCLSLLDEVDADGIVITKHGRPVARLVAIAQSPGDLIGAWKGRLTVLGDITTTGATWDAESRHARPRVRARR